MLEPSDLNAAVNRMLIGLGQIITAAVLLAVVALVASQAGNLAARNCSVLALGLTTIGYALQLKRQTLIVSVFVGAAVGASWGAGLLSVGFLILMGK